MMEENNENTSPQPAENQNDVKQESGSYSSPEPAAPKEPLAKTIKNKIHEQVSKVIIGQEQLIDLLTIALLTEGHVLIEGVPGIAKTTTAKLFSKTISAAFSRIQFTPDLMPTDVTGTSIFNLKNSEFEFKKGPIFANVVLVDEINRAPAKTQAALFEVMEEQQVSIDGNVFKFEKPFIVLATQNPVEQEGTYKLPEAQLDRFIFKAKIDYPNYEEELSLLTAFNDDIHYGKNSEVEAVIIQSDIDKAQAEIEKVHVSKELIQYIAKVIQNTRNNGDLYLGASPRASIAILKTAKAKAAIQGRNFVTPEDIQEMMFPILNHRIMLSPDKEIEGVEAEEVIQEIIKQVDIPR